MKMPAKWRAYDAWQSPAGSGHVGQRAAHLALDRVGREQRLGVHRVHVVDAVEQRRLEAAGAEGARDDVEDDGAAEAADVDGPGRASWSR